MARKRAPRHRDHEEEEEAVLVAPEDEGFVRGTVKKLFETGVAVPLSARTYLLQQIAGWKTDFIGIFQAEIRRFLDRQDPGEDLRKLIAGQRLEVTASVRLVPEDGKPGKSAKPAKKSGARPRKKKR